MTVTTHQTIIAGQSLHRLVLSPSGIEKGGLLFFHGQGDYIDRYPEILAPFVKAGYRCLLTDLPGHGRSPGKRGEVPSMEFVDDLFHSSLAMLPKPHLIAGHSMGGLLALHFLLQHPDKFSAAWLSSPLLDPIRQAKPWMRLALPAISHLFPWLTVGTGVRSDDCGDDPNRHSNETSGSKPLYHSRISLGWGRNLRDTAANVTAQLPSLSPDIPILFTQGLEDPVCPAEILREHLSKLPPTQLSHQEIPEARHEPFSGSTLDQFLNRLEEWIQQNL